MPSAQRDSLCLLPRPIPSHTPWDSWPSPQSQLPDCRAPPAAGGRERQEQASPGKGETHWKSRLGVSVSTVTRESLQVSQHSFTEIIHGALRTARPGCTGGPTGTREPHHHPATGQMGASALDAPPCSSPAPLKLRAPPTPALCIQDPTPGTAAILRSNTATPKIPPTPPQAINLPGDTCS